MTVRPRHFATFGIGVTLGATACALLTTGIGAGLVGGYDGPSNRERAIQTGLVGTGARPAGLPPTVSPTMSPSAEASVATAPSPLLPSFEDCEELRRWYVDAALPQVGPWGFGAGWIGLLGVADRRVETFTAVPGARDTVSEAVGGSDTGTNIQESGIDEPDVAKTDGQTVYRVRGRVLLVVDVSGPAARRVAQIRLPGGWMDQRELMLVDDTLVVTSSEQTGYGPVVGDSIRMAPWAGTMSGTTHLVAVDVSSRAAPAITSHQRVDGKLMAAREYGDGTVRVVTGTGLPPLDFFVPNRDRTPRQATRLNREVVRDSEIADWLPGIKVQGESERPLLGCTAVRHPAQRSGVGTINVLTFEVDEPTEIEAVALTASGDLVYSSAERLYVATMGSSWEGPVLLDDTQPGPAKRRGPVTAVHSFALEDGTTSYAASGEVEGTVRDRWSLSEHDGRLRVATALGDAWNPEENAVSVLEEDDGRLRTVGRVAGLGPGESIQSVRWFGDLAVVVTFRQTDPLYTLDLADPTDPTVVGELKIRGFSAYLHPVGDGRLLGLGRDASKTGVDRGAQAALFDLEDLADVARTDTIGFARAAELAAATEPRSFTYLPEQHLALTAVISWRRGGSRLLALSVGVDGSLEVVQSWPVGRGGPQRLRALPLGEGRVAMVGAGVRIIDVG